MSTNIFEQQITSMKLFLPILLLLFIITNKSFAMQNSHAEYHPDNYLKRVSDMNLAVKRVHRHFRYFSQQDLDRIETKRSSCEVFCKIHGEELFVPINVRQEEEFTLWFDKLALDQKKLFIFGVEFIKLHKKNGIQ